jgi:hypothetical protein
VAAYRRKRQAETPEKVRAASARFRAKHPDKVRAYDRKRRAECADVLKARAVELYRLNRAEVVRRKKRWRDLNAQKLRDQNARRRKANPEKAREKSRLDARRRRLTVKGRLENRIRVGLVKGIVKGSKAGRKTFDILGYTPEDLKAHLEKLFLPGMSWANFGPDWHIDHVIPLAAHNYETPDHIDFKRAWALQNLRPLWSTLNKSKGAKLAAPFQPSFAI